MSDGSLEGFRLSPQQSQLWQQSNGRSPNAAICLTLTGKLNPQRLRQAVAQLAEQHEALRANYQQMAGITLPLQVVSDDSAQWQILTSAKAGSFQEWAHAQTEQFSSQLIHITSEEHELWLKLPALNADHASLALLVNELIGRYSEALPIEEEITQYIDYSEWQNEMLEEDEGVDGRSYWQHLSLSAVNQTPPFITASSNAPQFTHHSHATDLSLLEIIAKAHNSTPQQVLLASWHLLLWRMAGHPTESVVGVAFGSRDYEGLEDVIGLMEKQLPLVLTLEGDETFGQLVQQLAQAQEKAKEALDDFAWSLLPDTPLGYLPLAYAYQTSPTLTTTEQLAWQTTHLTSHSQLFALKLVANQQMETVDLQVWYDQTAVPTSQATQLSHQLGQLLVQLAEQPNDPLKKYTLVDDEMCQQLLVTFNETPLNQPLAELPLPKLFEQKAETHGTQTAVTHLNTQLTFAQLNQQANQLAHALQAKGVQSETAVAIYLERSPDVVVALLAVLKLGATYVPLDLTQPTERLGYMMQQAGIQHLVTQQSLRDQLPDTTHTIIDLTQDQASLQTQPTHNPTTEISLDQLAYIIFTSGSTGQPKGVAVAHRQLTSYLQAVIDRFELRDSQNFATVSTFAADLGHTAVFPPLVLGKTLHIVGNNQLADVQAFAQLMQEKQIDTLKITPSHLSALLIHPHPQQVLPQKQLILGGEATSWSLLQTIQNANPNCTIYNHYGPTETTVGVITNTHQPEQKKWSKTFPIGKPLHGVQAYVLDPYQQPVPIWEPGELFIGGSQVTQGYLNAPEQTAVRYPDNPYQNGTKLYRTGDLVRRLPDGHLEFLGRVDHQVKLRGYRIELGDVESAISQSEGIQQAIVLLREDKPDQKQLVAYVVPESANIAELRQALQNKLPDYMIPSRFVPLADMPLTANGKIDRRALPIPDETATIDIPYAPPSNPIEETITHIWAEILERPAEEVGVNHDFFALGGHSLRATQVLLKVNQAFDIELSLRQLFEASTITLMAEVVTQASLEGDDDMDDLLAQLEGMSDEEAADFLGT